MYRILFNYLYFVCISGLLLVAKINAQPAKPKPEPVTAEIAIQIACSDEITIPNISGQELAIEYRIYELFKSQYEFKLEDKAAWLKLLNNQQQSFVPRLCAVYYLIDVEQSARDYVLALLKSEKPAELFNAAKLLDFCCKDKPNRGWIELVLLKQIEDKRLDPLPIESNPDRLISPIDDICSSLGTLKSKAAVPVLIDIIQRLPNSRSAILALAEIRDPQAIPLLMKLLTELKPSYVLEAVIASLTEFKHQPALPIFLHKLQAAALANPKDSINNIGGSSTNRALLDALLAFGDPQAIPVLEQFIQQQPKSDQRIHAQRVLIQLKSQNPVNELIELYQQEQDKYARLNILDDLMKFPQLSVAKHFYTVATTADSAHLRQAAIGKLAHLERQESLIALSALLEHQLPKNFNNKFGDKSDYFRPFDFHQTVHQQLKFTTGQDFGTDRAKWDSWIRQFVRPFPLPNKR